PHLEVDLAQRLHRAERLRDVAKLKEGGLVHGGAFPTTKLGGGARMPGRLHRGLVDLLAVLRVRTDANVGLLQESIRKEPRVVRLRVPDDGKRERRLV